MFDSNQYLEQQMQLHKNRYEHSALFQPRSPLDVNFTIPTTEDEKYWYHLGVYDGYLEIYLKINGFERYSESHLKD